MKRKPISRSCVDTSIAMCFLVQTFQVPDGLGRLRAKPPPSSVSDPINGFRTLILLRKSTGLVQNERGEVTSTADNLEI